MVETLLQYGNDRVKNCNRGSTLATQVNARIVTTKYISNLWGEMIILSNVEENDTVYADIFAVHVTWITQAFNHLQN